MRVQLIAGTALVFLASCFAGYETAPEKSGVIRKGDFTSRVLLTGELEAARGGLISVPQLPTWQSAIKWLATEGTELKPGDPVVELDNSSFTADLDSKLQARTQALQELQQKEAEWLADLREKELDLEKKRAEFEKARIQAAVPAEIISSRDFEERRMRHQRAEVELKKADAVLTSQRKAVASDRANLQLKLARAEREAATAQKAIDALVLRAPRAGVVVIKDHPWEQRKLQNGDTVWVGFPIAMIPELDSLRITAALPDVDDGQVTPGMKAKVTLDGYPDSSFRGVVEGVSAVAQESKSQSQRRMFRVTIRLEQIDPARMRPGLSARVEIDRRLDRNVLIASRSAIEFADAEPRIRLASGKAVPVKLGDCNAQECVVLSGVEEGARLGS